MLIINYVNRLLPVFHLIFLLPLSAIFLELLCYTTITLDQTTYLGFFDIYQYTAENSRIVSTLDDFNLESDGVVNRGGKSLGSLWWAAQYSNLQRPHHEGNRFLLTIGHDVVLY